MSNPALDEDLAKIMADVEKSALTPFGALQAQYLQRDLDALSKLYVQPETRPLALAELGQWAGGGGLRKRIADHWIERSKGIVTDGLAPAGGAKNVPGTVTTRKIHPLLAKWRAKRVTTGAVA